MRWPNSAETHVLRAFSRLREREVDKSQVVDSSNGRINRGLVHVALLRMEEAGMLHSRPHESGSRLYWLTTYGEAMKNIVEMYDRNHNGDGHFVQWENVAGVTGLTRD